MTREPFKQVDESFLAIQEWSDPVSYVTIGFTTRQGGYSDENFSTMNLGLHVKDDTNTVIKNREKIASSTPLSLSNWVFAEQTHSNHIKKVTSQDTGKGIHSYDKGVLDCDGLYTNEKGIMLSLCFADCVPLYFFSAEKKCIGLAHAGWQGTVKDISGEMIKQWQLEGIEPQSVKVAIGPSIEACCYVVDDRVISAINELSLPRDHMSYEMISQGQYKLDLKQLNKNLLIRAGVKEENILTSNYCTSCDADKFFSHRRDHGKTGRMLSFIGLGLEA
ncbi:peptidoglycan editing factor PgeF [Bacillus weihaiensis]|uniref:peptidoglycan editing factor PgeF n=1 Tax=Bacillus weihaiensis TaxID=1547283 RepID=UPI0023563AC4|nr:peptidoglycan editing factor PgeF [Bacillus weihaiensis]